MGPNDKRKYQRNCAFSFQRKRTAWNKRKDKTTTLDTHVNLAENDKGTFDNQTECLEEYEYGKGIFYSEYGDGKNCLLLLLSGYEKRLLQSISDTKREIKTIVKEATSQADLYHRSSLNVLSQC